MKDILTTQEVLEVFKEMKLSISRQRLHQRKEVGHITPYFSHPNFSLWRVDHIEAFVARVSKERKVEFDSEDFDNVVKFILEKRNGNS
jgi:spore coat polysaccharide biosynthesis protein SpsF (cytidylyltransferase family)